MQIGYARVSSNDQTLDTQIEQLQKLGCERIFKEKQSGKSAERAELQALIDFAKESDVIHVLKVDRLARNTIDALQIADRLQAKGVGLIFHDLAMLDINSQIGRVIYTTISAFAEMERKRILQRCDEGRALARLRGQHLGRFPNPELHKNILDLIDEGINKKQISIKLGCSRTTVYRVLNAQEKQ